MSRDIIFKTEEYVFSYRVAGLLIRDQKILLQRPANDEGYSIPGGHVTLGETAAETLVREFKEEIDADVVVKDLRWIGEIYFPWGVKPCHQICLYYAVSLTDEVQIPLDGKFYGIEGVEDKTFELEFTWISLDDLGDIVLYPSNVKALLAKNSYGIEHFVYREAD